MPSEPARVTHVIRASDHTGAMCYCGEVIPIAEVLYRGCRLAALCDCLPCLVAAFRDHQSEAGACLARIFVLAPNALS